MPTIKDVALRAGVSVTTVSRVLNNRGYISEETRTKVERAMAEVDYHPNEIARALQKSQSFLLGVITPDSNHPFFAQLIQAIESYASQRHYNVLLCNSLSDEEKEQTFLAMLKQNRVDGLIMGGHTLDVRHFTSVHLPLVSFDRILSPTIPYVASDNFLGGQLATEHLIARGCRRLLHIAGTSQLDILSNRRGDAFRLTCMKHDVTHDVIECAHQELTFDYYWNFIHQFIAPQLDRFDGVFCSNDTVAYALYVYCLRAGIAVPDQLKIIGYDNNSFTQMLRTPQLTTVHQPVDKIGQALAATLIHQIEQPHERLNHTVLDVQLIVGETT